MVCFVLHRYVYLVVFYIFQTSTLWSYGAVFSQTAASIFSPLLVSLLLSLSSLCMLLRCCVDTDSCLSETIVPPSESASRMMLCYAVLCSCVLVVVGWTCVLPVCVWITANRPRWSQPHARQPVLHTCVLSNVAVVVLKCLICVSIYAGLSRHPKQTPVLFYVCWFCFVVRIPHSAFCILHPTLLVQ